MSNYGILVQNKDGHALISSEIETPHFAGLADLVQSVNAATNKIEGFAPSEFSDTEINAISSEAADKLKPDLMAKRIADAKTAGSLALQKSIEADGTSVNGNVTTIRTTNPDNGIVTTKVITKVINIIEHPATYKTVNGKQVVDRAAYTTSSVTDNVQTTESTVSVIQSAYDANFAASAKGYDATIEETRADYRQYYNIHNLGVKTSLDFANIGKSFIHTFQTPGSLPIAPLFFINPSSTAGDIYGVMRQYFDAGYWKIDIIQSGEESRPPNVAVFKPLSDLTNPSHNIPESSESFGIVTYMPSGAVAFDSRRKPLVILHAEEMSCPEIPCNGGKAPRNDGKDIKEDGALFPYNPISPEKALATGSYWWEENKLDFDFKCNNSYTLYPLARQIKPQDIMFCAPAVTTGVYSRRKKGFKDSKGQKHWGEGQWWVMYHQGFGVSGGQLKAGWCVYKSGFMKWAMWESGGMFGGGGGSRRSGDAPYPNKTVNLKANTVLVSDLSLYYP